VTVSPLEAVALRETGPWSARVSAGCGKLIVCACGAAVTWKERETEGAAV
jgi:hypothetical protein